MSFDNNSDSDYLDHEGLVEQDLVSENSDAEFQKALEKAMQILDFKMCSSSDMGQRLRLRGFSEESISKVVKRLEEIGLIDDKALARAISRSEMMNKAKGSFLTKMKLRNRGIEESLANEVVEKTEEENFEAIRKSQTEFILKRVDREIQKLAVLREKLKQEEESEETNFEGDDETNGANWKTKKHKKTFQTFEQKMSSEINKSKQRVFSAAARRGISPSLITENLHQIK